MAYSDIESRILKDTALRPGYHTIRNPWSYLRKHRRDPICAVWRLWRRGEIRIDWRLRLWPVAQ